MWNALFETVESAATKIAFKQNHSQKKDSFPGLWENAFRAASFLSVYVCSRALAINFQYNLL